jgi:hypothetical protein
MGVVDVGRAHAFFQLKATLIIPGRDAVLGLGVRHDDDAWHVVLPFGSETACVRDDQAFTNALDGAPGPVDATPSYQDRGNGQRMRAGLPAGRAASDSRTIEGSNPNAIDEIADRTQRPGGLAPRGWAAPCVWATRPGTVNVRLRRRAVRDRAGSELQRVPLIGTSSPRRSPQSLSSRIIGSAYARRHSSIADGIRSPFSSRAAGPSSCGVSRGAPARDLSANRGPRRRRGAT